MTDPAEETISEQSAQTADSEGGEPSVAALSEQLAAAQAVAAEYLDNWRRSIAEMSNARKRLLREQEESRAQAGARIIEKLLPIVDDFDRAFAALPADAGDDWIGGFRLIHQKLRALLESEKVTVIPTSGERFDPELHHAITLEEVPGFADGDIIAEVTRGYRLGDRVLRPSLVRVAKTSPIENEGVSNT